MPKISKETIQEILDWLSQHKIDCTYAKLHRHFSNGVALATLLKDLYPRLVEMHNYPPQNSFRLKMQNLETLNAKVLTKLGIQQKTAALENIAKGVEGAIEALLYNIMLLEQEDEKRRENGVSSEENYDNILLQEDQVLEITVNKKIGDALVKIPQQMVLYSLYEKTVKKAEQKREQLKNLEMRLFQAENELEQRRTEVEKLIRHEENREYRKRLSIRSNVRNETQRSEQEPYSQKSFKVPKSIWPSTSQSDSKTSPSSKTVKDAHKPNYDMKIKINTETIRKGPDSYSIASRRERKSSMIPVHIQNVK